MNGLPIAAPSANPSPAMGFLPLASRLVLASHNAGKLAEFVDLLAPLGREVVSAGALGLPEPEETGATFTENALLKAHAAAQGSGLPALADDSGLSVTALDGAPGIYSARWAGPEKDFDAAIERVRQALSAQRVPASGAEAAFFCVIALAWPNGQAVTFEGTAQGRLVFPPRGPGGFGYDSCFLPTGKAQTFAEMGKHEKQSISHRAQAVARFRAWLAETSI